MKDKKADSAIIWILAAALVLYCMYLITASAAALILSENTVLANLDAVAASVMGFALLMTSLIFLSLFERRLRKDRESANASKSNIQALKQKADRLYEQCFKLTEKYMLNESDAYLDIAKRRSTADVDIESYPELRSNEQTVKLLTQIEGCERDIMNESIKYNYLASLFNGRAKSFLGRPIAWLLRMKPLEYTGSEETA